MTATLNGLFNSAPDTPSPVYPDRLIRPLPKRTLRSRLTSETADSILYPPAPEATQLFYGACATNGDAVNDSKVYVQPSDGRDQSPDEGDYQHMPYENGIGLESGDEDGPVVVRRSAGFRGSSLSPSIPSVQPPSNGKGQPVKSPPAGPDGYDAFENTNNKKKRKIPTPGNMGGHHSSLSPELTSLGLANSNTHYGEGDHVSTFYGTGNPASPVSNGISGSGRGRLGRQGRRLSVHGHITWQQSRATGRRDGPLSSPGPTGEPARNHGIISAAIASAAATAFSSAQYRASTEQPTTPTTPTRTQFTFTCESDSSKKLALHAQNPYSPQRRSPVAGSPAGPHSREFSTQGTQTSPTVASQLNQQQQQQPHQPVASPEQVIPERRKKKRSPGSLYALAARQRKTQQQYANAHHTRSLEDMWICEFCDYESIFGRPPEALIRQYEIKDRKERKRLAEKKRLLEKAKTKGRKHKKATRNATKNSVTQQSAYDQGYDRASVDHSSVGGGPHDEEHLRAEYEDEVAAAAPPPPSTFKPPLPPGSAAKNPSAIASGGRGTREGDMKPP
ncbi:hypothetical protein BJX99DRAFT_232693 [Aspergillus californicus]